MSYLSGLRGFEHFASWWNGTGFMRLRGLKYDDAMNFRWTPDLTTRNRQPELMDDPGLDEGLHHGALRGLARLNVVTRSSHLLWVAIRRLADEVPDRPLRILDVASGGGDVASGMESTSGSRDVTSALSRSVTRRSKRLLDRHPLSSFRSMPSLVSSRQTLTS
jgi:hypothetical protein